MRTALDWQSRVAPLLAEGLSPAVMGLPRSWGSRGGGRLRARAVSRLKALAEAATKCADVGGTADLQRLTPDFAAVPRELEERGITTPAAIGAALGMLAAEATKLLTQHQWREGGAAGGAGAGPMTAAAKASRLTQMMAERPWGGPSYSYRGASIECALGGHV